MDVSPSSSAQAARQALADRLRELRLDAGLTARALSTTAGWHEAKTSRIEHGKKQPSEADIVLWARACNVPRLAVELVEQLRAVDSMWLDWRRAERTGLPALNKRVRDLYERTRQFRFYSSVMIPGPLQTAEYVHAILTSVRLRRGVEVDDIEAAVAERMDRQRSLFRGDHRFAILLEEATLRSQIGGPQVQARQLEHLLQVQPLPAVSLGVIPTSADRRTRQWGTEMFFLFDDAQVSVELVSGFLNVTKSHEVAMYASAFADLSAMAVYGDRARSLIKMAASDLSS